jgi:hypothetical protein
MNNGTSGALALILLWVAFAAFFVSFHPGGIRDPMFVTPDNPQGYARNPPDVIIWMIKRAISGSSATTASADTATPAATDD